MEETIRVGRRSVTVSQEVDRSADQMLALAYRLLRRQPEARAGQRTTEQDSQRETESAHLQEART